MTVDNFILCLILMRLDPTSFVQSSTKAFLASVFSWTSLVLSVTELTSDTSLSRVSVFEMLPAHALELVFQSVKRKSEHHTTMMIIIIIIVINMRLQ